MPLTDDVKAVCDRLAPLGWRDLLLAVTAAQLDIAQPTTEALKAELTRALPEIDRSQPGFEDFSRHGRHGMTPGLPAQSLLYHALASPGVLNDAAGVKLRGFPTLRELEVVENYVFGIQPPSVAELLRRVQQPELAVVVFAYEYRPARHTCARVQADLAFSRTGIARVGTDPVLYDPERRGFWVEVAENPFGIRVCPAKYGAFLSVRMRGDQAMGLPMRHQEPAPETNPRGDAALDFWVPIHKLFDGTECIQGLDLKVDFAALHFNDKIRRIHLALGEPNPPATPPYRFTEEIAELATDPEACPGLLTPVTHARLVEPAMQRGTFVTFIVPAGNASAFGALETGGLRDPFGEIRSAPAYVHARTQVRDGKCLDLNHDPERPNVLETVSDGKYEALHYVDFTGEGEVGVSCETLTGHAGVAAEARYAYSLIAAPDFFPAVGQREVSEWTTSRRVPISLRDSIWATPPAPLCNVRLPANLQLPKNSFDPDEVTVTAIVPMFGPAITASQPPFSQDTARHSCLPDDAAGVLAPGWDVSHDHIKVGQRTVPHLAAYGLGSPFPEDVKLCAALSAFRPAVAPDASRAMEPHPNERLRATVSPLTDEEIGQIGPLPWDGNPGPRLVTIDGQLFAECESFSHLDYVQSALDGRFSLRLTARVSAAEYERRTLAMALTHRVLGGDPNGWFLLSFLRTLPGAPELQQAEVEAAMILPGTVYRCDIFRLHSAQPSQPSPTSFRRRLLPVNNRHFLFVDPQHGIVLHRRDRQTLWTRARVCL